MNKNSDKKMSATLGTITDELKICLGSISDTSAEKSLMMINAAERIFCAGAGRSGLSVRGFAMRLMQLGKPVHVMGDVTTPGIKKSDFKNSLLSYAPFTHSYLEFLFLTLMARKQKQ